MGGAAAGAGAASGTGIAGASAGMAGSGAAMGVGMGSGGATAASLGGSAMGTGTLSGSMAASAPSIGSAASGLGIGAKPTSNFDWQNKLKKSLSELAETKLSDLSFRSPSFSPNSSISEGYNESALRQGYRNSDLYNQLMQQQMLAGQQSQVRRYKQGV